jgi:hypothetical protein
MADARGQRPTGQAPFDPGPGAGDPRSVKVIMGQGPPPVPRQSPGPATAGGAGLVMSAVLALLFGGAGAWAYERFLSQPAAERPPAAPESQGRASETRGMTIIGTGTRDKAQAAAHSGLTMSI